MRRRYVLASLTSLLAAGCLGAKRPEDSSPVRTEGSTGQQLSTRTRTPTPEPTETATPTPEPTETETETPTESAEAAAGEDALEAARNALDDAAETFADDGELTEVSAATVSFDARSVLLSLDDAQRALVVAETEIVDDQTEQLERLQAVERFLTNATLAQSYLVDTYLELDRVSEAIEVGLDEAEDAEDRFDMVLERVNDPIGTLKNDVDGDAVADADLLEEDGYEDKLEQFDTEREVFRTVAEGLNRLVSGMDELDDAREEEDSGDDDEAADHADEALELFDVAWEKFDDASRDAPTDSLEDRVIGMVDLADAKYDDAEELYNDTS